MRDADRWVLELWRAAAALKQAALPYVAQDARLAAAVKELSRVIDGERVG